MTATKNGYPNPYIYKVEYAFAEDVETIINVELYLIEIVLKSGKSMIPIYGTPATLNFTENQETSPAGILHKQKLSLYYPGIDLASQPALIELQRKPVIALIYFQNGLIKVMGSMENPALAAPVFDSSASTGHTIAITCSSDEMAKFLHKT